MLLDAMILNRRVPASSAPSALLSYGFSVLSIAISDCIEFIVSIVVYSVPSVGFAIACGCTLVLELHSMHEVCNQDGIGQPVLQSKSYYNHYPLISNLLLASLVEKASTVHPPQDLPHHSLPQ